jgi:hypothetical protein
MDLAKFSQDLLPLVLSAGENVSKLVGESGQDLSYYRALYPVEMGSGLKDVTTKLAKVADSIKHLGNTEEDSSSIQNIADEYDEKVVDVLDGFLEEADHQLDLYYGRIKESKITATFQPAKKRFKYQKSPANAIRLSPEDNRKHIRCIIGNLYLFRYFRARGESIRECH